MYCLQWLIPVLLIPKPVNPALLHNHVALMVLYLTGFFLERKPCTVCSLVFLVAVVLVCNSGWNCLICGDDDCQDGLQEQQQQQQEALEAVYVPQLTAEAM